MRALRTSSTHRASGRRPWPWATGIAILVVTMTTALGIGTASAAPARLAASSASCAPYPDVSSSNVHCASIAWAKSAGIARPDGALFHPTGAMLRGTMAAFLYRLTHPGQAPSGCVAKPFPDVAQHDPNCASIQWAVGSGVTSGYPDGRFHAERPVTRGAMAAFFYRITHVNGTAPRCSRAPYSDVRAGSTFCGPIAWLKSTGITQGFTDGTYRSAQAISRQAMAAFVQRTHAKYFSDGARPAGFRATRGTSAEHAEELRVLAALNDQRAAHGLPALRLDANLTAGSLAHNKWMARINKLTHQAPGEPAFMQRDAAAGAHYRYGGENVGRAGFITDWSGLAVLMNSMMYHETPPNDGHRRNILSPHYTHVGISVYIDYEHHALWLTEDFGGGSL